MNNSYVEPVTEIPKLLREFIKKKYPNYKFSVTRTNYNMITVDLLEADFDAFVTNTKNMNIRNNDIQNNKHLTADAKRVMQDIYDFLSPNVYKNSGETNFYLLMNVGTNYKPYKNVGKKSYSTKGGSYSTSSTPKYDKGTLIRTCGGWELYKATTKTNKIVYNAIKLPNTPLNKIEWNVIKGDITTQTGFKYQYGVFTKWGEIDDERINRLCQLFEKYYTNQGSQTQQQTTTTTPTTPTQTQNTPSNNKYYLRFIELYDGNDRKINTFYSLKDFNENLPQKGSTVGLEFEFTTGEFIWINNIIWQDDSIEDYIEFAYPLLRSKFKSSNPDYFIFEFEPTTPTTQTTTPTTPTQTQNTPKSNEVLYNVVRKYLKEYKVSTGIDSQVEWYNLSFENATIHAEYMNMYDINDITDYFYVEPSTNKQNVPTTTTKTPKLLKKADYEIRIKGLETLMKYATDQSVLDAYNIKLNGLKILLKYS